jgi:hypothetical protein
MRVAAELSRFFLCHAVAFGEGGLRHAVAFGEGGLRPSVAFYAPSSGRVLPLEERRVFLRVVRIFPNLWRSFRLWINLFDFFI